MARIKKKGLDYFPFNTDFIHDRAVRRLMKREGDAALSVLVEAISYIYAGEGYYVLADRLFCEDLSAGLYETSAEDVDRIIRLAVEYGLFDDGLYREHGILTSQEIQQQYLFSTRRRKAAGVVLPQYSLLPAAAEETACNRRFVGKDMPDCHPENVAKKPQNVATGTHSTAQHSTAEHSREKPHLCPPRHRAGEEGCPAGEEEGSREGSLSVQTCGKAAAPRYWTQAGIDALTPPPDGTQRNFAGLLENLRGYDISPTEQYAIIRKSNYGAIGGPVWRGLATLRTAGGKIKLPGRYLLSIVARRAEVGAAVC